MDLIQFTQTDVLAFVLLGVVVSVESVIAYRGDWPERKRWFVGWCTLFGLGVFAESWDMTTVLGLAGLSLGFRLLMPLRFWQRREGQRWSTQYTFAFFTGLIFVGFGVFSERAWLMMFICLGIAGAIKMTVRAYLDSRISADMRRKRGRLYGTKK